MKPKPPRPIWCVVDRDGIVVLTADTMAEVRGWSDRIIRYIPAPTKRRKRRKGYRAGGMS